MSMSVGPSWTQAQDALQAIAHTVGGTVTVASTKNGVTVNGQSISHLTVSATIARDPSLGGASGSNGAVSNKDTVAFSPKAMAFLSGEQIALGVIQDSVARSKGTKTTQDSSSASVSTTTSAQLGSLSTLVSASAAAAGGGSQSAADSTDAATVLAAYAAESTADRFYAANPDPEEAAQLFAGDPEKQASFITAYNNKTLNIQDITEFMASDTIGTTYYTDRGSSSGGGSGTAVNLSSLLSKNVMTFSDGVMGGTVITW